MIRNTIFRLNYKTMMTVVLLLSSNINLTKCEKDDDWMNKFAKKGKEAIGNVDFKKVGLSSTDFSSIFSEDIISKASAKAHAIMDTGAPGQIGYGFMMGYSSGYCLKKVSKVVAFAVGGIFIALQSLSYNGYMNVNYGKIQKDVEKIMDLNHDGKVDEKDAKVAYDKLHNVLSYNMPTGGGFSAGLLMGLRG